MRKVFVSYRHVGPDEGLATALSEFLEKRGCDVFLDTKIGVGLRWVKEIERQIRLSQCRPRGLSPRLGRLRMGP